MKDDNTVQFLDKTSPPHLSTLILLSGIGALAMNMFLPSLPAMAEYFGTEYAVMQLSVPLYLLFSAGLQLIIGPVSDNLGRRNVLLWGLVIYMVATLGCIYAPTTGVFLMFRCAQAIVAVTMVLSRAIVRDMFTQDKAASMIGYVTMGMALVPMIQPPIMRALTTKAERRIVMTQLRQVSQREKIVFPILLVILVAMILPDAAPLLGMFCFGNLMRECGVVGLSLIHI